MQLRGQYKAPKHNELCPVFERLAMGVFLTLKLTSKKILPVRRVAVHDQIFY